MIKFIQKYKFLISLFFFSLIARLISLHFAPPSLNWDEVSIGYNAYSISKTFKDEWGQFLPLIFRAYGDYKLPLYLYLTAPLTLISLSPISIKLVSLLAGSLSPVFLVLIAKHYFPDSKYIPILSGFLLAFSPWSIFLSTIALEANLFLCLVLISIYFLLSNKLSLSAFFYALCLFTYNSSRVLLPFYLIFLVFQIIKTKYKFRLPKLFGFLLLFTAIAVFLFQSFFSSSGQARYQWVSLVDQGTINRIEENRNASTLPSVLPRLVHNKATYFVAYSLSNYSLFFSPSYMFFQQGTHFQFNLPHQSMFASFLIVFYYLGIVSIIINIKNRKFSLISLLLIFLISPLPSAITRDAPHILRSILFYPFVILLISHGLDYIFQLSRKNLHSLFFIIISLLIINRTISYYRYLPSYSLSYASSWQYGYQQAISYIKQNYPQYDHILISKKYGEPHEFLLFFWPWDPKNYQNSPNKSWNYHAQWYWVDAFDKFVFLNDWDILSYTSQQLPNNTLLITSPNNYNDTNSQLLRTIYDPANQAVFDIVKYENQ